MAVATNSVGPGILLLASAGPAPSWRVPRHRLADREQGLPAARGCRWNDGKFNTVRAWRIETRDEKAERHFLTGVGFQSPKGVRQTARERYRSLAARAESESNEERGADLPLTADDMTMLDNGPLTDAEIRELDDFLLDCEGLEEAMDVSTLDGFLTAILCGPTTIMPNEWMRWVWDMQKGEDSPTFRDQAQAQRVIGLLMRHMNDIAGTLHEAAEDYEPLLMENPNDGEPIPVIDEWCFGFMRGVQLDAEGWAPFISGQPDVMSTILLCGTEEGWDELREKDLSLDAHKALAAGLGDTVRKIHAYWLVRRRKPLARGPSPDVVRREPIRNPDKVGRNDPCPCGSGRKFKQCHGKADRLH